MYNGLRLPWSKQPSAAETAYRHRGLVRTHGSMFLLPPDHSILTAAFNAPPRPKSRMSAGAVALCKHFERGDASSEHGRAHPFWPLPVGSNENKSAIAAEVLRKMLNDAQWRNVLMLHRGVAVYEVRNGKGYGMRWTLELDLLDEEGKREENEEEANGREMKVDVGGGVVDGRVGKDGEGQATGVDSEVSVDDDDAAKQWTVRRTLFRGFLEPIVGLDHELVGSQLAADSSIGQKSVASTSE